MRYTIRQVASIEELEAALDFLGAQFKPPITHADRRFDGLRRSFPQDRRLMLVAEQEGRIAGGALGCGSTLSILAVALEARGAGLGRRLIQTFEAAALRSGVSMISLGAIEEARGFYTRMGYRGKRAMFKELPLPGAAREHRLRKLEAALGDLEAGQVVECDEAGRIPPLF
jgi:GNAT superfamily N-acetyltransferase